MAASQRQARAVLAPEKAAVPSFERQAEASAVLTRLHELARELAGPVETGPALNAIVQALTDIHRTPYGFLLLYDAAPGVPRYAAAGFEEAAYKTLAELAPDGAASAAAFAAGKHVVVENAETDPRFARYREFARRAGFRTVHSTPVLTRDGRAVGVISAYLRECRQPARIEVQAADICAGHAAEIVENSKIRQRLSESERRFHEIIDALPVAIYTTDAEGYLTHFNPAAAAFSGRTPELGKDRWCVSWKLYRADGTPLSGDECPMAIALREGRIVQGGENIIERPDGKRIWFAPYPALLRDAEGHVTSGINMLVDITGRKQGEEARKALNDRMAAELADMQWLQEISIRLIQEGDVHTLYHRILDAAVAVMHSDMASMRMLDSERNQLQLLAWHGFDERFAYWEWIAVDSDIAASQAVRSGRRIIVPDVEKSGIPGPTLEIYRELDIVSVQSTPLVSRSGRVLGIISTHWRKAHLPSEAELRLLDVLAREAADLIERAQVEEALRTGEQQLRTVLNAGKFGYWERDQLGLNLVTSNECKAQFGFAPDDPFTYEIFSASIHPADRKMVKDAAEQAFAESGDYQTDFRCIWPDGSIHWINARGRAIAGRNGQPVRLFGVTLDITERKRWEAWLAGQKRVLEMLATGANLHETLTALIRAMEEQAEGMLGSVFIRSGDGSYFETEVGPTLPESYSRAIMKNPPVAPPYIGPCAMAAHRGEVVVAGDISRDERWSPQWRDLAVRHGLKACYSTPIFASDGRVLGSFGIYYQTPRSLESVDLQLFETASYLAGIAIESSRAQQALRQNAAAARDGAERLLRANERLRHANLDLQQFAYSASHDLQEPLRNIAVYSEMVNRRYAEALNADGKEFLGYITAGARRLEMLIKDLLAYTQIASAPDEASGEADVAGALSGAISNLSESIREAGAEITSDPLPRLRVREIELQQLLQNLIGNAIKYRRPDESPHVHVSAGREGAMWCISVSDNGIGIAPEYLKMVFGMFKRLHTEREYPGTGMGLAICQKIVERHGGRIRVESEPGKGSTFVLTLPGIEDR